MHTTSSPVNFRPMLTLFEVKKKLSIGTTLLYKLMDNGMLPFVKVGRNRRVLVSTVEEFIRKNTFGGQNA